MKNKLIILIVVLAIAAGAAIVYSNKQKAKEKKQPGAEQQAKQPEEVKPVPLKVQETQVAKTEAPQSFPKEIPVEAGAKILQNYNATVENGIFQATRVFETAKSLDDNFKLYKDALAKNGWTLLNSVEQTNVKVMAAKKDKGNLQITISENPSTHVKTVDLTYSEQR